MKFPSLALGLLSRISSGSSDVAPASRTAVRAFAEEWQRGSQPAVEDHWTDSGSDASAPALAALVKAEMRGRFERGEHPEVAEYLDRFPCLQEMREQVVSLVYEEYCLREEHGEPVDPDAFCARYEPWRDSVEAQLRCHRLFSAVVTPVAPPPTFPEPGDVFQGFRLLSVLGRGGVARVYLATDPALGEREVALKIAPARGKEPAIQGRLDHPHIVPVLSVTAPDPASGLRGLCMPYRKGISLDEVIGWVEPASRPKHARVLWNALAGQGRSLWEQGPTETGWRHFPIKGTYAEGAAWIVLVLARALEHAHSQGILHRDVKPANVLLSLRDGPQLLDFNLAYDPNQAEAAQTALRGGTLPYMAPEQLWAFLDPGQWERIGPQADLYALGLVLRELLTGARPEAPDPALPLPQAVRALLDLRAKRCTALRFVNPAIPDSLEAIAERCLALEPENRYATAAALADDLERFVTHKPLKHAPNRSKRERAKNWTRRNRYTLAGALALALAIPTAREIFRHDPNPAETYVNHGVEIMKSLKPQDGREMLEVKLDKARDAFERARALDPNLFSVYQGLASVASHRGDFAKDAEFLSKAIELAERSHQPADQLTWLYQMRGTASMHLGTRIQAAGKGAASAYIAAQPHFIAAQVDLRQAQRLGKYPDSLVEFHVLYDLARAEVGLGDVASRFDNYEKSVERFEAAERSLQKALSVQGTLKEAHDLARKHADARKLMPSIALRLQTDRPVRDRLRQVSASKPVAATPPSAAERPAQSLVSQRNGR